MDGAPRPVIDLAQAAKLPPAYDMPTTLARVAGAADPEEAMRLRNQAIAVYMGAMNARYAAFRRALSNESKGWNAGLGIGVLGVSSVGAVAGGASNELAALAAFLSGSRSVLNKELFFDRTLPALIAAMDAGRTRVRTALVARMRDEVAIYPMEMAFADLASYELSASLDAAIQEVTAAAVATANAADAQYKSAVESCYPDAALQPKKRLINNYIYDLRDAIGPDGPPAAGSEEDTKLDRLAKAAAAVGAGTAKKAAAEAEAQTQADGVADANRTACTARELQALIAKIETATGEKVGE